MHGTIRSTSLGLLAIAVALVWVFTRGGPDAGGRGSGMPNADTHEVESGGVIAGTIRYPDGRTLGGDAAERWLMSSKGDSARIADDGSFRFTGLRDGTHDIWLKNGPTGWALSPRRDVPLGTEDLQLELQRAAMLAGRVVDAEGKGVKARVFAQWPGSTGGSPILSTDDDGRFEIEVPPDFAGSVHTMPPDSPMVRATAENVSAGRTDLELRIGSIGTGR